MGEVKVQPDAALALINDLEWSEDDMTLLREFALCVEADEPVTWEWESHRTGRPDDE